MAPAEGIKIVASSSIVTTGQTAFTPIGSSFAAPLVTAAAAMVWATHRDWTAAEVANALVRSATPLPGGSPPSRSWGWGRLDVRRALRMPRLLDSHSPTTGPTRHAPSARCTRGRS